MTQRLFIALLTAGVFAAGYAVRAWTERGHAVPPPPAALASEYAAASSSGDGKGKSKEFNRAELVAEIEKLRPQIEAYRTQVEDIYGEFDREFSLLLDDTQKKKFVAYQKRWTDHIARRQAERAPLSDEDIMRARERPMTEVYWMVTVTPRLERLTKEYNLDAAQQTATRALLTLRRNKFLALLDSTAHPSIRLSRLAPVIERVAEPQTTEK